MARERILVIEDDEDIQTLIAHNLARDGFQVTCAPTAEEGLRRARTEPQDCILLDLMLPGMDGLEACRQLKKDPLTQLIPVIMITAKGEESDVVTGLELGADDYIVKPFSPRVLAARIKSIFRRRMRDLHDEQAVLSVRDMTVHPGRHEVTVAGQRIDLTHMEFRVLHFLASRPGWVFTREQIIEGVRDDNYPVTERSVDVIVVGLRRKLGEAGQYIETVRGVGYKFVE